MILAGHNVAGKYTPGGISERDFFHRQSPKP
jgi:hypothetical protein